MGHIDFREDLCRLISYLTSAASNVVMYGSGHPRVYSQIEEAHAHLAEMLKVKKEITFALLKDRLILDGMPLVFRGSYFCTFIDLLRKNAIHKITFCAGLPFKEFELFIHDFALAGQAVIHSTKFIKTGSIDLEEDDVNNGNKKDLSDDGNSDDDFTGVLDIGMSEPDRMVKDIYERIKSGNIFDAGVIAEIITTLWENIHRGGTPLSMLASLKTADEYTFTHAVNVGILTMSLAESIGFSGVHLRDIGTAALLHDVGKILVPEELLSKKGSLTGDERKIIENHALQGARQLMKIKDLPKLAILVALEHHMKCDGSGYPYVKGKWKTNIVSQMISIADVFDALRTRRPYREPMSPEEVERILRRESGVSFNPFLLERFLEMTRT